MVKNIAGKKFINQYVKSKSDLLMKKEIDYDYLFELMFSEKENIIFEWSEHNEIKKISYGEAYDSVIKLAGCLKKKTGNDKSFKFIGLAMDNSPEWIYSLWAILKAGYCPFLINLRLPDETIDHLLEENNVKYTLCDHPRYKNTVSLMVKDLTDYEPCNEKFGAEIIVMSSGTSSNVKLCAYGAEQVKYQILDCRYLCLKYSAIKKHYKGELKHLAFLPFYHIFGLIAVYMFFGFFSRTFVFLKDYSGESILTTIRKHKVTHIFAVPLLWDTIYKTVIKRIKKEGQATYSKFQKGLAISKKLESLPLLHKAFAKLAYKEIRTNMFGNSVSYMISGGSNIDKDVLSFFNSVGYPLSNGYGMSEIGITSLEADSLKLMNSASVGVPFPSDEYKTNENDELFVRGHSLALYVKEGEKITYLKGDWFKTNDLAKNINDHYYILGRKDDVLITSTGENINPGLLESQYNISMVNNVFIFKEDGNSKLTLLVSVSKNMTADIYHKIYDAVKNKTDELHFLPEVGKIFITSSPLMGENDFKLNRTRIRKDFASGKFVSVFDKVSENDNNSNPIKKRLCEIITSVLECSEDDISDQSDILLDLGADSLEYAQIRYLLEEEYSISLVKADKQITNIGEIVNMIEEVCKNYVG